MDIYSKEHNVPKINLDDGEYSQFNSMREENEDDNKILD